MDELTRVPVMVKSVADFDGGSNEKLLTALTTEAQQHGLRYLLAYHDDGVVWGWFDGLQWVLSAGKFAVSPPFRALTLQECRVFGPTVELLIWRDNDSLKASTLIEGNGEQQYERFEQTQLLWGTRVEAKRDGFTLLREKAQGLRHAVPLPMANFRQGGELMEEERARLTVYHYIDYEDDQAYVRWSRLASVDGG